METKKCCTCTETKNLSEFNKNKSKKDGYNNICRICSNIRSQKYYNENSEKHKLVIRARNIKLREINRIEYFKVLKNSKCIDCNNSNPLVLDFDHKDGVDKLGAIGEMVHAGYSWKIIEEEIAKCDVRCANCHRIRTAHQFNWVKLILL